MGGGGREGRRDGDEPAGNGSVVSVDQVRLCAGWVGMGGD